MILVKNTVTKNPAINNKLANGKTSISSPSCKYYSKVSADSGRICSIATLIKRAPAKVDPMIRYLGLVLKAFERRGNVPIKHTMTKNSAMNTTLRIDVVVSSYIRLSFGFGFKLFI